jgi:hypothetical protein
VRIVLKVILIISNSYDLHADVAENVILRKKSQVFRLNLDHFPRDYYINFAFSSSSSTGYLEHIPSKSKVRFSDIYSIWLRKKADFSFLEENLSPQELVYAKNETEHILFSMMYLLSDKYWISHPKAVRGAIWKGEQLCRARADGFLVPDTLLTNIPIAVKNLYREKSGHIIYKTMASPLLGANEVAEEQIECASLQTTLLSDEDMNSIESIQVVPGCFQGYVEKEFELRVTVIGDSVFAAKIDSQSDERTKIDSRNYNAEVPYSAIILPTEVEQRCLNFVHGYGLNYGAIDIIVSPNGDYIFLENNPMGQFYFIEQLIPEFKMMDKLVDCLLAGKNL